MAEMTDTAGEGLSPRVRGNQDNRNLRTRNLRSIPAGAGEPPFLALSSKGPAVYPRGCGGTTTGQA